jgi:cobalamin biosynthesis protein CobT
MPTEAELRLMKARQLVINRLTKTAAAMKEKDAGMLADLSQRQGTLRDNLDKIFKKAGMKDGLGPPPDKKDIKQLPEEANEEKIEDDELEKNLLSDKPIEDKAEKDIGLVGDRMFRSKVRLGDDNDPGTTTQKIQERIVKNMDDLIQMARQASAQGKPKPGDGQPGEPKDGQPQQANNQGKENKPGQSQMNNAQQPAQADSASSANENDAQLRDDIKNTAENWGKTSPRLHDAVIEGAGEQVIEKYQQLVKDYYRSLATKSKGQ